MQTVTGLELNLFERAGYFIRREMLQPALVEECLAAADRVVEKCRAGIGADVRWSDSARTDFWGVNNLFRPETREEAMTGILAHAGLAGAVEDLLGPDVAYHLATLLVNPQRARYHL